MKKYSFSFRQRYNMELPYKINSKLTKERARSLTPESLDEFFKMLKQIYSENGFDNKSKGHLIFNCDETSFSSVEKPSQVYCHKKSTSVNSITGNNDKQTYTVQVSNNIYHTRGYYFIFFRNICWKN